MTLKLWTWRSPAEAERLLAGQVLRAGDDWQVELPFVDAYRWMISQMEQRLGPPPPGARWPLWAWAARPDHRDPGTVCLALELPRSAALLSDFGGWHCVVNQTLLAATPELWAPYEALLDSGAPIPPPVQAQVEASWQGIFDLARPGLPGWTCPPERLQVQATLWELRPEWVRGVVELPEHVDEQ